MVKDRSSILVWRIVTLVILAIVVVGVFFLIKSPKSRKIREANSENILVVKERWNEEVISVPSRVILNDYEPIIASKSGTVIGLFTKDKAWVKAGTTIAKLADFPIKEALKKNTIELNKLNKLMESTNELDAQQKTLLSTKIRTLEKKIEELKLEISKCDIKTPVSGFISNIYIKQGQEIPKGFLVGKMGITKSLLIESTIEKSDLKNNVIDSVATLSHNASDSNYVVKITSIESNEIQSKITCEWKNPPSSLSLDHQINIKFTIKSLQNPLLNRNLVEIENNKTYINKLVNGEKLRIETPFTTTDSINFLSVSNAIQVGDTLIYFQKEE